MVKKKSFKETLDLELGVVIIGYNRLTKSVIDIMELIDTYNIMGIIDIEDNTRPFITSYKIFDGLDDLLVLTKNKNIKYAIICVQDGKHRKEILEYIEQSYPGISFINLIHPSTVLGKNVILGKGNIIGARTVINSYSKLGDFCLIKDQVSIGHDGRIENFVTIHTNTTIGGKVCIGNQSFISPRSNIINNVAIGKNCFIKESALVLNDVPDGIVVEGVPCKIIN